MAYSSLEPPNSSEEAVLRLFKTEINRQTLIGIHSLISCSAAWLDLRRSPSHDAVNALRDLGETNQQQQFVGFRSTVDTWTKGQSHQGSTAKLGLLDLFTWIFVELNSFRWASAPPLWRLQDSPRRCTLPALRLFLGWAMAAAVNQSALSKAMLCFTLASHQTHRVWHLSAYSCETWHPAPPREPLPPAALQQMEGLTCQLPVGKWGHSIFPWSRMLFSFFKYISRNKPLLMTETEEERERRLLMGVWIQFVQKSGF